MEHIYTTERRHSYRLGNSRVMRCVSTSMTVRNQRLRAIFLAILLGPFALSPLMAQLRAPKYSNEFLAIGVGARALGMSNAQVAHVNDVTSAYWNPAGLLGITDRYEVSLMHSEYFAGIAKYDYAGFAARLDSQSVIAITGIRFGVDDIPDTRFLFDADGRINYDNVRFFSAADYGFFLSYARKFKKLEGLRVGGSLKVIYRTVGQFANAWGFGIDAGAQYEKNGWLLGASARDVTSTFNAWSINTELLEDVFKATGNEIPQNSIELTLPRLILGVGRKFRWGREDRFGALGAMDLATTFDGRRNTVVKSRLASTEPSVGVELDYKQVVFLRGGVGNLQEIKDFDGSTTWTVQPNFGIGLRIKNLQIDYAFSDVGDVSAGLYSNTFSLKFGINP